MASCTRGFEGRILGAQVHQSLDNTLVSPGKIEFDTMERFVGFLRARLLAKAMKWTAILLLCSLSFMLQDYRTIEVYEHMIDTKDE